MAGCDRHADNPAAARLYNVTADDVIFSPIGSFDQHIRLKIDDNAVRRLVVKYDDRVDTAQRLENLSTLCLSSYWTPRTLVGPNRPIGVDGHDEDVAKRAGVFEVADMTWMEQVEHAVRENDRLARGMGPFDERPGVSDGHGLI